MLIGTLNELWNKIHRSVFQIMRKKDNSALEYRHTRYTHVHGNSKSDV
jgi:hypothetical protein